MKLCLLFIPFGIVFLLSPTLAQQDNDWEVVVYDNQRQALIVLDPNGIREYYLFTPPFGRSNRPDDVTINISSDHGTAIVSFTYYGNENIDPIYESYIFDLDNLGEGRLIPKPPLGENEIYGGYRSGAFSPDNTQVILPYISHDITSGYGCCDSGGMVIIDLATATITKHVAYKVVLVSVVRINEWTEQGIFLFRGPYGEFPYNGFTYQLWDPVIDRFSETTRFENLYFGDRLSSNGDVIISVNHPDFPVGGSLSGSPERNVVEFYQNSEIPGEQVGQVVYYELDNIGHWRARWVLDGQAFLVQHNQSGVLVFRDGSMYHFTFSSEQSFLSITPDGWLMVEDETSRIFHYQFHNVMVDYSMLADLVGEIELVSAPTLLTQELEPYAVNISPPDGFFCRGFLPSRLQINGYARVIVQSDESPFTAFRPGVNRWGSASATVVPPLPYGAIVKVLYGPECGTWEADWLVEYEGQIGWMYEGAFTTYYLAPAESPD